MDGCLFERIENELEVYDPICDGDVTYAEGMAFATQIIKEDFETYSLQIQLEAVNNIIARIEALNKECIDIEDLYQIAEEIREEI